MEKTLIKAVRMDDGLELKLEGTTTELLVALTALVERTSKITGLSVEHICFAMTGSAKALAWNKPLNDALLEVTPNDTDLR